MIRSLPTIAAILFLASASGAAAQSSFDWSAVEIKTTALGHSLYMLEGRGGNIGVSAGEDGVFVIDDQYAPLTPKILDAIAKITPKPVRFVVNTHWHGDHTGGNENLGNAGVTILAHENVRARMSTEQVNPLRTTEPAPKAALPLVTFADGITVHLNGLTARATHVANAHTDGDTFVRFDEANVIHAGDVFFNGIYPFIDVFSGGSIDGMIAACDAILALADDETKIIPGHGALARKADLVAYRAMLADARARIAALVAAGKTEDEAVGAAPLLDLDAKWGQGFVNAERMTRLVYLSLKGR